MFQSILFRRTEDNSEKEALEAPAFFVELNLDKIIEAVTTDRQEYNLKPFFYASLKDTSSIRYRQEIARDLENETLLENIKSFTRKMVVMRQYLDKIEKLSYKYQKEGWFLEAVETYSDAVNCLAHDLSRADIKSQGLSTFQKYLSDYIKSDRFTSLFSEMKDLKNNLATVNYCMFIKGDRITVSKYESEIDYSPKVAWTFEKFKQSAAKDYRVERFIGTGMNGMNRIEAEILNRVAKLYPDIFTDLNRYCTHYAHYPDKKIGVFEREIQFYIAYLDYIAKIKRAGLKFCYPQIVSDSKEISSYQGFDLALADKCISENTPIVCNDFYLKGEERILVVSGPDQGGKTTFSRTFGQLHYLAGLGVPVPGREAQLFLWDRIFVHFEKEENIKDLRGKLEDDLVRVHAILEQATSKSILIINKIFSSTTLKDAVFLSQKLTESILRLDALCVWVTSEGELSASGGKTVSMVSTVVPENPSLRTYKIVRMPADGLSYTTSIAEKYRLTYDWLQERIKS